MRDELMYFTCNCNSVFQDYPVIENPIYAYLLTSVGEGIRGQYILFSTFPLCDLGVVFSIVLKFSVHLGTFPMTPSN